MDIVRKKKLMHACKLICFLLLSSTWASSQEFAPVGAVWNIELAEPFAAEWTGTLTNTSLRDTMVKGESCKVIYKSQGTIFNEISGEYILCQIGDTVSHYIPELDTLNVVMDFGADVGETWETFDRANEHVTFGAEWNQMYLVDSITYLKVSEEDSLRVQHLTAYSKPWDAPASEYVMNGRKELIQHIGFRKALLPINDGDGFSDDIFEWTVRCYEDDALGLFNLTDGENCIASSTNDLVSRQISLFPNPTNGEVLIDNGSGLILKNLNVFNAAGVRQQVVYSSNSLSLHGLSPGIYMIKLDVGNSIVWKKIVKAD